MTPSHRLQRWTFASVTVALLALLIALVPGNARAADGPPTSLTPEERFAGNTRIETAIALANDAFPTGSTTVMLARADAFPDALAAAYLGGDRDAALLLTETDNPPQATLDALDALDATDIILLGGTAAISQSQQDALELSYQTTRIFGGTRYETAQRIALAGATVGTLPEAGNESNMVKTAILATGENFPDALAAGGLAFGAKVPLLLTTKDALHPAADSALDDLMIEQVILVGGTAAISDTVKTALEGKGLTVLRLFGDDRTGTAAAIADYTANVLGWDYDEVAIARGDNFPDALALAQVSAKTMAPTYLTRTPTLVGTSTFEALQARCGQPTNVLVAGGTGAVSQDASVATRLGTTCADVAFPLTGDQETSPGSGSGFARLFFGSLCYAYNVTLDDPATAAHIHRAIRGSDGPVVATLEIPSIGFAAGCLDDTDVAGSTVDELSAAIQADPFAYYVNVHNATYPGGAVRGQLTLPASEIWLTGSAEIDSTTAMPVASPAPGSGFFSYDVVGGAVCYHLTAEGLDSTATAAHIHEAAVDGNGPVVLDLHLPESPGGTVNHSACVEPAPGASTTLLQDLTSRPVDFYVNLHTKDTPSGALRGQLGSDMRLVVNGDAETDGAGTYGQGDTDAYGTVEFLLGEDTSGPAGMKTLCYRWDLNNLDDATFGAAHIHAGRVDENGPVVVGLGLPGEGASTTRHFGCVGAVESAVMAAVADPEGHYFNGHTATYGGGAVRGQLVPDWKATLRGDNEVPDPGNVAAQGSAWIYVGADDMTVCSSTIVRGLGSDVTGAHIHTGAAGSNGGVLVALEAPVGEPFEFGCFTGDGSEVAAIAGDPSGHYVNVHTSDFAGGALRGQLG